MEGNLAKCLKSPENVSFVPEIHGIDTINNVYKNLATRIRAAFTNKMHKPHSLPPQRCLTHQDTSVCWNTIQPFEIRYDKSYDTKGSFLYTT